MIDPIYSASINFDAIIGVLHDHDDWSVVDLDALDDADGAAPFGPVEPLVISDQPVPDWVRE